MATATVARRTQRMSAEARRRQILDVGTEIFSRRGYSGTTTKEIAKAMGVSEAILFRHFASKEVLYSAILDELMPRTRINTFLQGARELAERRADYELFTMIAAGFLWCHREEKTFNSLLMRAAVENHGLARPIHLRTIVPTIKYLREYITKRQAEGAFHIVDPEPYALALVGCPSILGYWRELFGFDAVSVPDDELATRFAHMLLATLLKRPDGLTQEAAERARTVAQAQLIRLTQPAAPETISTRKSSPPERRGRPETLGRASRLSDFPSRRR